MKIQNYNMKKAQEATHNKFFFQNFQNNEIFEILKIWSKKSKLPV